jgi:hypothetical protein
MPEPRLSRKRPIAREGRPGRSVEEDLGSVEACGVGLRSAGWTTRGLLGVPAGVALAQPALRHPVLRL